MRLPRDVEVVVVVVVVFKADKEERRCCCLLFWEESCDVCGSHSPDDDGHATADDARGSAPPLLVDRNWDTLLDRVVILFLSLYIYTTLQHCGLVAQALFFSPLTGLLIDTAAWVRADATIQHSPIILAMICTTAFWVVWKTLDGGAGAVTADTMTI
jgi:hypothetical protein